MVVQRPEDAVAILVLRCEPAADDENDRAVLVCVNRDEAPDSTNRVQFVCVGHDLSEMI